MCCFSRDVERVAGTRIFARLEGERQTLVYAMTLSAKEELALVLPLPTPAGSPSDAVSFVSLSDYPAFFEDLESGFPRPPEARGDEPGKSWGPAEGKLEVVRVGAFDASFVPSQKDFARLDERFRIAPELWARLPAVQDYGFAVFLLRKGQAQHVHPMALRFKTRHPKRLFFPTVHIHHGEVTAKAEFDHVLYAQFEPERPGGREVLTDWRESPEPAGAFVKLDRSAGLVRKDAHAYRRPLRGLLPNADTFVALA